MESLFQVLGKPLDLPQTPDDPEYYLDPWFLLASRPSSSATRGREYSQKDLSFSRELFFSDRAVETSFAGLAGSGLMMKPDSGLCFCYSSRGLWSGSEDQSIEFRARLALIAPHWIMHDGPDAHGSVLDRQIHSSRAFGRCENFSHRINNSTFSRYWSEHSKPLLDSCLRRKYIDLDTCFTKLSLPRVDSRTRPLVKCWFACVYFLS